MPDRRGVLEIINDPERRAAARREQGLMRERFGHRLAKHPAQANYMYGQARVQTALDQLGAIARGEMTADDERRTGLYNQLAEGLALQGKFEEAGAVALDERYKQEYQAKAEAMRRVGERRCECPAETVTQSARSAKGDRQPSQQRVEDVWDASSERVVGLMKCLLCECYSAQVT